jgi:spermidine/putrescine transport system permease protein
MFGHSIASFATPTTILYALLASLVGLIIGALPGLTATMGVALLVFFGRIGWPTGLPWPLSLSPIVIGHVAFSFPFVAVVVRARLASFDHAQEEASRDLGANEWQTFWNVTVPYLKPALIAGALLAMTLSLDDFVITFFTSRPETVTFPVLIYSMVRFGATPEVNAASTVLIAVTLVLTAIAVRLQAPPKGEEVVR